MKIEVSNGEILDKHTILKIKLEKITDPVKVANLNKEWMILTPIVQEIVTACNNDLIHIAYQDMLEVNRKLWQIEDEIRDCEKTNDFGEEFIKKPGIRITKISWNEVKDVYENEKDELIISRR